MAAFDQYGFKRDKTKYDLDQIQSLINDAVTTAQNTLLEKAWPIGSIFLSVDAQTPTQKKLPGTWTKMDTNCYLRTSANPGNTYGSLTVKLKASDIPAHAHRLIATSSTSDEPHGTQPTTGAEWRKCRLIKYGTGTAASGSWVNSQSLPIKLKVRRGHGNSTPTMESVGASILTVKQKDETISKYSNLIETSAATATDTTNKSDYPDTFAVDLTSTVKIDGFTSDGIYDKTAYNAGGALVQTNVPIEPKYIAITAWKRIS